LRWIVIGTALGLLVGMPGRGHAQTPLPLQLTCEAELEKASEYVRALVSTQIKQEALLGQLRTALAQVTRERDQLKAAPKASESPPPTQ